MARARKFYSSVFNKELNDFPMPGMEMAVFPWVQGGEFAMGSLVKAQGYKPSSSGTIVYFSCEDLSYELGRVGENNRRSEDAGKDNTKGLENDC
jgi:predicted enzyme related to lactoylglutathione lyase